MSEFKGTPGEWSAEQFGSQIQVWSKADTSVVCVVGNMGCTSNDRQTAKTQTGYAKANARLIAAAPELLEALQLMIAGVDGTTDECGAAILEIAREAIAKATEG